MEIVDPADLAKHQHHWLQWLGLEEPPPQADSWVPVVRGLQIDDAQTQTSVVGARLVDALGAAGIEAHQRLHEFYDIVSGGYVPQTRMEACVGIAVHDRDLARAVTIAEGMKPELEAESPVPDSPLGVSEEELTREALEAGPAPPD